ncbi:MAG: cytochrome C [Rhodocyclaceae bacterium]|nr:cytochrome C [Rhodocyclaceae bacterium]
MTRSVPVRGRLLLGAMLGLIACSVAGTAVAAVDAVAAKKMARKESCLRCHALDRKKEGPSYQAVAYKYKDQADAQDKLVEHITAGKKVKLTDGHEETHKITKTKDPEQIKNLIAWILAQ